MYHIYPSARISIVSVYTIGLVYEIKNRPIYYDVNGLCSLPIHVWYFNYQLYDNRNTLISQFCILWKNRSVHEEKNRKTKKDYKWELIEYIKRCGMITNHIYVRRKKTNSKQFKPKSLVSLFSMKYFLYCHTLSSLLYWYMKGDGV